MQNIVFKHPTLFRGKQNNIDGAFDAMLDDTPRNAKNNAELTIFIRLHLYDGYYDGHITKDGIAKDADGDRFPVFPWQSKDFQAWKKKLIRQAQTFWHGKFWLQTPVGYSGLNWPDHKPSHRPNIWCRFELSESLSRKGSHFSIACVNLGASKSFFRSHSFLYDSNDPPGTKIHEVGHLLGLDHPSGKINEKAAYRDRPGYPDDVMGEGSKIQLYHAAPWQKAIGLITGTRGGDWYIARKKLDPKAVK